MAILKQTPCVYIHLNKQNNQVFYVGMSRGNQTRPNSLGKCRNARWQDYLENVLGSDRGLIKVVVMDCQTVDSAYKLEKQLIERLQPLANIQLNSKNQKGQKKVKPLKFSVKSILKQPDYVDAKALLKVGNVQRKALGKKPMSIAQVMNKSFDSIHWGLSHQEKELYREFPDYNGFPIRTDISTGDQFLIKPLALKFASIMSLDIETDILMVVSTLKRKARVNAFKSLSNVVSQYLPIVYGETYDEIMEAVEVAINQRFFTEKQLSDYPDIWASHVATCGNVSERRIEIEYQLVQFLKNRLVNNTEHLISIIENM